MAKIIKFRHRNRTNRAIHTFLASYTVRLALLIFGWSAILLIVNFGFHTNLIVKYFFTAFWIYVFYIMSELIKETDADTDKSNIF